ncbi:alpha-hydroxy-acid oxidizing protein [uncultured Leifsonia sp.]|uniref:alpha-hydroxy-acid oxidizing protein n=1 Tax=uncultured Leifsonia sp. TaxID=340359 RepID=UPI0028D2E18F|nr:alpha-hydroxy-acid oxidizing protein [uncultured Leifsonia sp.]
MTGGAGTVERIGASIGRAAQSAVYRAGVSGRRPAVPVGFAELERLAARRMSRAAFAYIAGSAGLERTAAANLRAFRSRRIVPRVLRDVAERDLSIELFGRRRPTPLLLAPIGVLELARRDGDVAAARAAARLGVPAMLSTQASVPMERVGVSMDAVAPGASRWFQLYWSSSRDLVASLVARAEASGCEAIVVTLDTHLLGWRPRDLSLGYLPFSRGLGIAQYTSDPVFQRLVRERVALEAPREAAAVTPAAIATFASILRHHPGPLRDKLGSGEPLAAVETFLDVFADPTLGWDDLAFLRDLTDLPIVLKGILHPDDARRAIDAGVDAVAVSNHGGRQIDGEVAALDALPGVLDAVAGRLPVLFDSGVRSGADALIALAVGARAVAVGRPYVYGLAIAGERGVHDVLRNILAELDITLGLAGVRSVEELTPDVLTGA